MKVNKSQNKQVGLYHTKTVYIAEEMTYEIKKQSTE
jgi:hypothetical protein